MLDVNEYADESIKLHFAERVDLLISVHASRQNHFNHMTVNLFPCWCSQSSSLLFDFFLSAYLLLLLKLRVNQSIYMSSDHPHRRFLLYKKTFDDVLTNRLV